jgi:6-phosphogluconolactonase
MTSSHLIYLGTYTRTGTSQGIYTICLDDDSGALSTPLLAAVAIDPSWITFSPDKKFLYANHPSPGQAVAFTVDAASGKLVPLAAPASTLHAAPPAHLAVDASGRTLLAANYAEGYVAAIPIRPDGTLGPPNPIKHEGRGPHPTRQDKAHVHSVTLAPDNRCVIVADLGLDRLFTYALEPAAAKLTPCHPPFVATAPGAGPRHCTFGPDGTHLYAINELANTITTYAYEARSGTFTPQQSISTLPTGDTTPNTTAEIRLHPNGRFVYGSNRGHDSIAVFAVSPANRELTPVEIVPSGGKAPRNFALSPNGKWLVCGHQGTDLLTVFRVDATTGRLTRTPHTAAVPSCVCVLFYD